MLLLAARQRKFCCTDDWRVERRSDEGARCYGLDRFPHRRNDDIAGFEDAPDVSDAEGFLLHFQPLDHGYDCSRQFRRSLTQDVQRHLVALTSGANHDPRKLSETVAYLADLSVGQLVWGTRTPNQNASVLVAHIGAIPTVIGPVDPPPPPKCPGCGDGFYARRDLEFAFRVSLQGAFADNAAWPPP